jgi:hypothetical protein
MDQKWKQGLLYFAAKAMLHKSEHKLAFVILRPHQRHRIA